MSTRSSGFIVLCDPEGRIREVLADNLWMADPVQPGGLLPALAVTANAAKIEHLLTTVNREGSAFGWTIAAHHGGRPMSITLNAVKIENDILVIGSPNDAEALETLADVVRINSELVTHVRGMSKRQAHARPLGTQDDIAAMSRLNNELVSLQRELARKNAELEHSQRLVSSIIDIAPTLIYIHDLTKERIVFANRGAQSILGHEDLVGAEGLHTLFSVHIADDSRAERTRTIAELAGAADGELIEWDLQVRDAQGAWRILHTRETVFARLPDGEVSQVIGAAVDVTEQRVAAERLRELALADQLTGLHNKRGFELLSAATVERAARSRKAIGVVFADLNDFKAINDECGHAVGDEALRLFAAALQRCARRADIVARFGGDEFVVLIDEGGDTGPSLLAERLHAELAAVESPCGRPLSASVGAAVGRVGGMDDLQALLEEADRAMYADKNRRKSAGA